MVNVISPRSDFHLWLYDTGTAVTQGSDTKSSSSFRHVLMSTVVMAASFVLPAMAQTTSQVPSNLRGSDKPVVGKLSSGGRAYDYSQTPNSVSIHLPLGQKPDGSSPVLIGGNYHVVPNGIEERVVLAVPGENGAISLAQYDSTQKIRNGTSTWQTVTARVLTGPNITNYDAIDAAARKALDETAKISENLLHPSQAKKRSRLSRFAHGVWSVARIPYDVAKTPVTVACYWAGERRSRNQPPRVLETNVGQTTFVVRLPEGTMSDAVDIAFGGSPRPSTPQLPSTSTASDDLSFLLATSLPPGGTTSLVAGMPDLPVSLPAPAAADETPTDLFVDDPASSGAPAHHHNTHPTPAATVVVADAAPPPAVSTDPPLPPRDPNPQTTAGDSSSPVHGFTTNYVPAIGSVLGLSLVPASVVAATTTERRRRRKGPAALIPVPLSAVVALQNNATPQVMAWVRKHTFVSELATGMATGSAVRMVVPMAAKFALAKIAFGATVAAVAASPFALMASGLALGMLAGGVSSVVGTYLFHKEKTRERNWALKAFGKGACFGTLSGVAGLLGFGLTDALHGHGWMHNLAHMKSGDWHSFFHGQHPAALPHAAAVSPAAAAHGTAAASSGHVVAERATQHAVSATDSAFKELTAHSLPTERLHSLVDSGHADKAVNLCLQQAREILNSGNHSAAATERAMTLLKGGLDIAGDNGVHGSVVEKLHITLAQQQFWHATPQGAEAMKTSLQGVMDHIRQSGHAMNDLGSQLQPFVTARMAQLHMLSPT